MTFPSVADTITSLDAGANTESHIVSLPPNIVAGNRVEIYFACDGQPPVIWPAGWTELAQVVSGVDVTLSYGYRDCDGTEGSTITISTTPNAERSAHHAHRITDFDPGTPPEVITSDSAGLNSNSPDPPSLNPSAWGTEDTLWTCGFGNDALTNVTTSPTNYTAIGHTDSTGTNAVACGTDTAYRQLAADSEDPGSWTTSDSRVWAAITAAHRPVGVPGFTPAVLKLSAVPVVATPGVITIKDLQEPTPNVSTPDQQASLEIHDHIFEGTSIEHTIGAGVLLRYALILADTEFRGYHASISRTNILGAEIVFLGISRYDNISTETLLDFDAVSVSEIGYPGTLTFVAFGDQLTANFMHLGTGPTLQASIVDNTYASGVAALLGSFQFRADESASVIVDNLSIDTFPTAADEVTITPALLDLIAVPVTPVPGQASITLTPVVLRLMEGLVSTGAVTEITPITFFLIAVPVEPAVLEGQFFFTPPTIEDTQYVSVDGSNLADYLFSHYSGKQSGIAVWRDPDGNYHQQQYPFLGGGQYRSFDNGVLVSDTIDPVNESLADATEVYLGGHIHPITQQQVEDLTAAGYGDFITVQ